jgi:Flp pilus assembly protein TadB
MKDIIFSFLGFLLFGVLLAVALWFSVALILLVFISSAFLAVFILLRTYYLRWRYKDSFTAQPENFSKVTKNTIVDVEYHNISDKN